MPQRIAFVFRLPATDGRQCREGRTQCNVLSRRIQLPLVTGVQQLPVVKPAQTADQLLKLPATAASAGRGGCSVRPEAADPDRLSTLAPTATGMLTAAERCGRIAAPFPARKAHSGQQTFRLPAKAFALTGGQLRQHRIQSSTGSKGHPADVVPRAPAGNGPPTQRAPAEGLRPVQDLHSVLFRSRYRYQQANAVAFFQ